MQPGKRTYCIIFLMLISGLVVGQQATSQHATSQRESVQYTFKEIGWTMTIPADFKIIDSAKNAAINKIGKKAMEDANNIEADITTTRTLISARKDASNYFSSTITLFDPKKDGDYAAANKMVKDMVYKTFLDKMPNVQMDSSSNSITLDGLEFDKFHISIKMSDKIVLNMFILSKYYKGYDFGISYLYGDETSKEQIESILSSSRFH